jgi:hypothetical protein
MMSSSAPYRRGAFLSTLIIGYAAAFVALTALQLVARIVASAQLRQFLGSLPGWYFPFVIGLDVARLVALVGLWKLRKWAVYPLFLLMASEVFVGVFVLQATWTFPIRLLVASAGLVVVAGAFASAISRRWTYFR